MMALPPVYYQPTSNPQVQIKHSADGESLVLTITRATSQQVNQLRRALFSHVQGVAVDLIQVTTNTTDTEDDLLAFRLGLIPIDLAPSKLQPLEEGQGLNGTNAVKFTLRRSCPGPDLCTIYAGDLQWEPLEGQDASFEPEIFYDDLTLVTMSPGQTVELTAYAIRGVSSTHSKFSPIRTFYFQDDGQQPPTFTMHIETLYDVDIRQVIDNLSDIPELEYVE